MKPHFLYVITNTRNGMRYVGLTANPARRWAIHKCAGEGALGRAIQAEGRDAFTFEVVACSATLKDAGFAEMGLIRQYGSLHPHGYNQSTGGQIQFRMSTDAVARYTAAKTGRTSPRKGVTLSQETRLRISVGKTGQVQSAEVRKRQGENRKGNTNARRVGVRRLSLSGIALADYPSTKQASEATGVDRSGIRRACDNPSATAGGYRWQYLGEQ